jgi:XisH protein
VGERNSPKDAILFNMARDKHHTVVRTALEKAGWTITDDPFLMRIGETDLQIDLGAERVIGAERGTEKIAVEIKVFGQVSLVQAFHNAVGQYLNYRVNLEEYFPDRELFLAVPQDVFAGFFQTELAKRSITRLEIKLLVFEPETEVIVWQS